MLKLRQYGPMISADGPFAVLAAAGDNHDDIL